METPTQDRMIGRAPGGQKDAREEIARTRVSPAASAILITSLVVLTAAGLITDFPALAPAWKNLGASIAGQTKQSMPASTSGTADRFLAWNHGVVRSIQALEQRMNQESPLCRLVQPRVQQALTSLGEGGDDVLVGRNGWLFYRPSFHYLTAPANGIHPKFEHAPDRGYDASARAIRSFAAALKSRGISLIVMPVPPKLAIHPEQFIASSAGGPLRPAGFAKWASQLRNEGIGVFDPSDTLAALKSLDNTPAETYLHTDTHWRPDAMSRCAALLANTLESQHLLQQPRRPGELAATTTTVSGRGDLWRMLRIPQTAGFPEESVEIEQVRTPKGLRWQPRRDSEVLLMGDSFCNIFSLGDMGWGEGAGFAEHLSLDLARPIDAILRNSDGAHATRRLLSQELARGDDRLKGKRVVIWEFAARELTEDSWPEIPLQLGTAPPAGDFLDVPAGKSVVLTATVTDLSPLPYPGTVPYQDHVATVRFRDLATTDGSPAPAATDALAYAVSMEANRWSPLSKLRPGQRIRIKLGCWNDFEPKYGRWNRSEPDEDLLAQPVNWLIDFQPDPGNGSTP